MGGKYKRHGGMRGRDLCDNALYLPSFAFGEPLHQVGAAFFTCGRYLWTCLITGFSRYICMQRGPLMRHFLLSYPGLLPEAMRQVGGCFGLRLFERPGRIPPHPSSAGVRNSLADTLYEAEGVNRENRFHPCRPARQKLYSSLNLCLQKEWSHR